MYQSLRHRFRAYVQHPIGRCAVVLMLFALVAASVPFGEIHAHADGDHDHDHGYVTAELTKASLPNPSDSMDLDSDSDSTGAKVLHAHGSVVTPPPLPVDGLGIEPFIFPARDKITLAYLSRPSATPLPPYRPPIA